jgi:hypothetical protein
MCLAHDTSDGGLNPATIMQPSKLLEALCDRRKVRLTSDLKADYRCQSMGVWASSEKEFLFYELSESRCTDASRHVGDS